MKERILNLLSEREMTVTELSKALGVSKATVSYHLEELRRRGLVKVSREELVKNFVRRYYTVSIPNSNVKDVLLSYVRSSNKRSELFRNTLRLVGFALLKTSPAVFKRLGFEVGRSFGDEDVSVEKLAELWEKLGLGKTSCTRKSLTVEDCYFCSGLPKTGYTYCKFDEGFIAGYLSKVGSFRVREVKCWGLGDEFCEFEITKV